MISSVALVGGVGPIFHIEILLHLLSNDFIVDKRADGWFGWPLLRF